MKNRQAVRSRWALPVALSMGAIAAGALISAPVLADPKSDFFQPDAFRTGKALEKRTAGWVDPAGRDCPVPDGPLTLPAAVNLALCRNPATRSAWAAARLQAATLGSAESAWLPSVSVTGSETRDFGVHVAVTGATDTQDQDTGDAAVALTWLLYDFGGRGAKVQGARLLLDASALTLGRTAQQTVFNVVQAYYGEVAGNAAVAAAKTAEDAYKHSVDIATALQRGGAASLSDVLQAETAYDQAVITRLQLEYQAQTAAGTLAVTIGSPADQGLKVAAEPVPAEVPALTGRIADLMAKAERQRPDLAAAIAQRDAAIANVTVARAVGRPSISMQAARTYSNATGVPTQNYNQVGLYVTIPIFTGFNVDYGVRQAQASLESSEVNVDQIRLTVSSDVWTAYYFLDSANQSLGASATLVKTADANQQVALGQYQAGVGTILNVLTALEEAATAAQARITAELNWEVSRAQLALALGRLTGTEPLAAAADPASP